MRSHCYGVSPDPNLLERVEAEEGPEGVSKLLAKSTPTGTLPGINDGSIFAAGTDPNAADNAKKRKPFRGSLKVAVVLVAFPDQDMTTQDPVQHFEDLLFKKDNKDTFSVVDYLAEVSNNKVSISGEVVGPYLMPHNMAEYAMGSDPNTADHGRQKEAPNIQDLARDAANKSQFRLNYSKYDNYSHGIVDAFVVVHAGRGAEQTNQPTDIWSVQYTLRQPFQTKNSVRISPFIIVPEDASLGLLCHEFGHLLFGWPDLYDTDHTSEGVGKWCLMGSGSWNTFPGQASGGVPCHPSAWCKANQEWVDVEDPVENQTVTLADVQTGRNVYRLWTNGNTDSLEYFLLENRQQKGFDSLLPGSGLLVWHIDDSKDSNADETHPKIRLMQADGLNELGTSGKSKGDAGDPFPGTSGNTSFTFVSNPNSRSYSNEETWVSVTSISHSSPAMSLQVAVKVPDLPEINAFTWYRLSNTNSATCLTSLPGIPPNMTAQMSPRTSDTFDPNQCFQFQRTGDTYRLRTASSMARSSLFAIPDIGSSNPTFLLENSDISAQQWWVVPYGDGTGSYYLSNRLNGYDKFLDTRDDDSVLILLEFDASRKSQRWTITASGEIK